MFQSCYEELGMRTFLVVYSKVTLPDDYLHDILELLRMLYLIGLKGLVKLFRADRTYLV